MEADRQKDESENFDVEEDTVNDEDNTVEEEIKQHDTKIKSSEILKSVFGMEAEDAVSYEGDEAVGNENEEELANSFGYDVIVEDSQDSKAN